LYKLKKNTNFVAYSQQAKNDKESNIK